MRLDEIKARAAAATEGPWVNDSTEIGRPFPGTDTITRLLLAEATDD